MVVGGGIAGLTVALPLASAGAEVTMIERRRPGAGSSDAAAGILSPGFEADLRSPLWPLQREARREWDTFAVRLGTTDASLGLRTDGLLVVADSGDEGAAMEATAAELDAAGWPARPVDRRELADRYTGVGGTGGGLLLPGAAWVEPRAVIRHLVTAFLAAGGTLLRDQVRRLDTRGGRVRGVRTDGGHIEAETVVLAAGAWSRDVAGLGVPMIEPVFGQMVRFGPSPQPPPLQLASQDGVYLLPRADGSVEVGATMVTGRWDEASEATGIEFLTAGARRLWPALIDVPVVETWTGLRPFAADGLPVVGRSTSLVGLYLATGYGRNGILIAPLCGRLLAEELTGWPPASLLAPFGPERFAEPAQDAGEM